MTPFEKILVPIDFAPPSQEAVRYAAGLALQYSSSLTLVHVYEPADYALPQGYVLYTPEQIRRLTDALTQQLHDTERDVRAMGVDRVSARLLTGTAAREIVEFARANASDLIVLGTHGRTGFTHFLLGSVAERVVRTAPCPVLTIKASESTALQEAPAADLPAALPPAPAQGSAAPPGSAAPRYRVE